MVIPIKPLEIAAVLVVILVLLGVMEIIIDRKDEMDSAAFHQSQFIDPKEVK